MALIYAKLSDTLLTQLNEEESELHNLVFNSNFFDVIRKKKIRVISLCRGSVNEDGEKIFSNNIGYDIGYVVIVLNTESNVESYFNSYDKYKENINIYGKNIYALIDIGDNFDGINLDDYDFYVDYFTYNTYFCGYGSCLPLFDRIESSIRSIIGVAITCEKKEIKPDKDVLNLSSLFPSTAKIPTKDMMLNGIKNGELWENVNPSFMQGMINNTEIIDGCMVNMFLSTRDFNQSCEHMDTLVKSSLDYKIYYNSASYKFDYTIILAKGADSYWIFWLSKDKHHYGRYSVLRISKESFNENDDEAKRIFEKYIRKKYLRNYPNDLRMIYHIKVKSIGGYITIIL